MRKVRIKKLPEAQSGLEVKMGTSGRGMIAGLGLNSNTMPWPVMAGQMAQPNIEVNKTLKPVERQDANLEAEKGETAFTDMTGDGIPQLYKIAGERHYDGGTPLNLPEDSFIYSRDKKMKIGGPILESFGKHKDTKDKFTPAELSAKYDINEYRKILADPDSDKLQRDTAELMISNYNLKLAKLGLVQESKKGFPDGIPAISMPYIDVMQIDPTQFMMQNPQGQGPQGMSDQPAADNVAQYGKTLVKAQLGYATEAEYKKHLTDPYSKEKEQAQRLWNMNHPDTSEFTESTLQQDISTLEKEKSKRNQEKAYEEAIAKAEAEKRPIRWNIEGIDKAIKENLRLSEKAKKGEKVLWGSGSGEDDLLNLKKQLADLMKQKNNNLELLSPKTSKKATSSTWTIDDYKKSLLDKTMPYSQKHQAQMDFLATNPQYVSQATASNVAPPVAQTTPAPQDKGVSASQTAGYNQPVPAAQVQTQAPVDVVETVEVDEEFKLGGSYQTGGGDKKIVKWEVSKKTGNKRPVYSDGTYGPVEKGTAPVAKTTTTAYAKPTGTPENFDPYGVVSPEMLPNFLTEEQKPFIRKDFVSGYQPQTGEGIYGQGVKVTDFMKRNPKFAETNPKFDPTKGTKKQFQSVYNKHVEKVAYEDAIAKGYPEDRARELAKAWVATQGFKEGDPVKGDPRYQDDAFGEFTSSRFEPSFKPYVAPPVKKEDAPVDDTSIAAGDQSYPAYKTPGPEWWLQDKVKMAGAFGDLMRIKKYNPWMATPGLALPEGTFYDPTRELAANAEQVNIGVQGASTYSGPQSFAATAAALQGQGAANAANIMGRYNNLNVTESNRLGDETAAILNQGAQQRAANATQLFDKQTIVNQQFDNSKNMARQNLRQGFIDAITNRANTYNLNTLYPQFAVAPGNGGMVYNVPGSGRKDFTHGQKSQTAEDVWNDLIKRHTRQDAELIYKNMYGNKGSGAESQQDESPYMPQGYRGTMG